MHNKNQNLDIEFGFHFIPNDSALTTLGYDMVDHSTLVMHPFHILTCYPQLSLVLVTTDLKPQPICFSYKFIQQFYKHMYNKFNNSFHNLLN
jgi:hypothetical protein